MKPLRRIIRTLAIAALFFIIGFVWPSNQKHELTGANPMDGTLSVHFIDVGEGDCALLLCDGEAMLIDAGESGMGPVVTDYLDSQSIRTIKYAVGSHNHSDHIGGMKDVIENCNVETLYLSPTSQSGDAYENMIGAAERSGTEVVITGTPPGIELSLGGAKIEFIGPHGPYMDANESSIVILVTYGEVTFLFTGDMEWNSEHEMMDYRLMPNDITVLKVAHHGSDSSTCYSLLSQLDPIYSLISCGEDNQYGYPDKELMLRLEQECDNIYRTDKHGSVVFKTDGASVEVETEFEYQSPAQLAAATPAAA